MHIVYTPSSKIFLQKIRSKSLPGTCRNQPYGTVMRVSEWILLNCRFAQARSVMITPGDIKHWSAYAQKISFGSEQEARDWIFRKLELAEQGSMGEVFGRKGLEYNRQYANQFPVYQSGKTTWK